MGIMIDGYKPNPAMCCRACVFGVGKHADFCEVGKTMRAMEQLEFIGSRVDIDPSLPPGSMEFRDANGNILHRIVGIDFASGPDQTVVWRPNGGRE